MCFYKLSTLSVIPSVLWRTKTTGIEPCDPHRSQKMRTEMQRYSQCTRSAKITPLVQILSSESHGEQQLPRESTSNSLQVIF